VKTALALAIALLTAGPAAANTFVARTAGAATAIALDQDSIHTTGDFRTGWTYELYRERNRLLGRRTQIMGVLELVNCKTLLARRLQVVDYLDTGEVLSRTGPEREWSESLRGSNTDLILRAMCFGPDDAWAHRKAKTVFDLYGEVWR
jgi:hypothetical protein